MDELTTSHWLTENITGFIWMSTGIDSRWVALWLKSYVNFLWCYRFYFSYSYSSKVYYTSAYICWHNWLTTWMIIIKPNFIDEAVHQLYQLSKYKTISWDSLATACNFKQVILLYVCHLPPMIIIYYADHFLSAIRIKYYWFPTKLVHATTLNL